MNLSCFRPVSGVPEPSLKAISGGEHTYREGREKNLSHFPREFWSNLMAVEIFREEASINIININYY